MHCKHTNGRLVGVLLLALACLVPTAGAFAGADDDFPTTPRTDDGRRWRIAYYQGGNYIDYTAALTALVKGLMTLGWIEAEPPPVGDGEAT